MEYKRFALSDKFIDGYKIYYQNEDDKFLSLAVCYRADLEFELKHSIYNVPGVMLFSVLFSCPAGWYVVMQAFLLFSSSSQQD